jgi:hypothetical protein
LKNGCSFYAIIFRNGLLRLAGSPVRQRAKTEISKSKSSRVNGRGPYCMAIFKPCTVRSINEFFVKASLTENK